MTVRIGCSGFLYEHWRGRFYPPSARGAELEWYARSFDTVELNVTFYRMPSAATFRSWATRVPDDFVFAVKASRYLTHVKRLHDVRDSVAYLIDRVAELGSHLGPILLQLPPDLQLDLDGLVETLEAFPASVQLALEPRHASWFVDDVRDLLESRQVALCLADRRGPLTPFWETADWAYVRFHGGRARPASCYGDAALDRWADRLAAMEAARTAAFLFFNNDFHGCALRDAASFAVKLEARGIPVSRTPSVPDSVVSRPGPPGDRR